MASTDHHVMQVGVLASMVANPTTLRLTAVMVFALLTLLATLLASLIGRKLGPRGEAFAGGSMRCWAGA